MCIRDSHTVLRASKSRSQGVNFRIRGEPGVVAELRNIVRKNMEVEVLPVVDCWKNRIVFFVGDAI